ncbi:hypothetical protein PSPL106493_18495 [Pseudomonas plecoglossicida]
MAARQAGVLGNFVDADRVFDIGMHQLQGQAHATRQARVDLRCTGRQVARPPRAITRQHLLHRPAQTFTALLLEQGQHHVQRTAGAGATHAPAVQHMGLAADANLGKQLAHHRPAVGMERAIVVVEQTRFGEEIRTIPQPAQLTTELLGMAQLAAQQCRRLQAHTQAPAHQQAVQALQLQLGQGGSDRQGDAQVAHHLGALAHHLDEEQRRGTHQVGSDQGIHGGGEGHHREVLAQDEGHPPARQRQCVAAGRVEVGQVGVLEDAFEMAHGSTHYTDEATEGGTD